MANLNNRLGLQNSLLRRARRHSQTAVLFRSAAADAAEIPSAVTTYSSIRTALDASPPASVADQPIQPTAAEVISPQPLTTSPAPTVEPVSQPTVQTPPVQRAAVPPTTSSPPSAPVQPPTAQADSSDPFSAQEWSRLSTIMRRHKEREAAGGDAEPTSLTDTVQAPWLKEVVQRHEAEKQPKPKPQNPPKPPMPGERRRPQIMYVSDETAAQTSPADLLRQMIPSQPKPAASPQKRKPTHPQRKLSPRNLWRIPLQYKKWL